MSSNIAKKVGDELLRTGGVKRSYFGVAVRDLDAAAARESGVRNGAGAVVTKVGEGSPAAKAGVLAGDVITKINGQAVRDAFDLMKVSGTLPVGQVVDVLLWRGGKFYIGKVKIEASKPVVPIDPIAPGADPTPAPIPGNATLDAVGLGVTDLTAETIKQLNLPRDVKGVMISSVTKNGLAEKSGLTRGLVVLKVDKIPVMSALIFEQALRHADTEKGALLEVRKTNGDEDFVVLRLK